MSSQANDNRRGRKPAGGTARGSTRSTLSVYRAFVVQFRESPVRPRRAWQGRVEHIASGRSAVFTSRAELLAFLSLAAPPDAPVTDETPVTDSTKEEPHAL